MTEPLEDNLRQAARDLLMAAARSEGYSEDAVADAKHELAEAAMSWAAADIRETQGFQPPPPPPLSDYDRTAAGAALNKLGEALSELQEFRASVIFGYQDDTGQTWLRVTVPDATVQVDFCIEGGPHAEGATVAT